MGLAMASFLEAINAPCKLGLVAFRERDGFIAIRRCVANRERYRIVARAFFARFAYRLDHVTARRLFIDGT